LDRSSSLRPRPQSATDDIQQNDLATAIPTHLEWLLFR